MKYSGGSPPAGNSTSRRRRQLVVWPRYHPPSPAQINHLARENNQSSPSRGAATTVYESDQHLLIYPRHRQKGWRLCARAPHPPKPSRSPLYSSGSTAWTKPAHHILPSWNLLTGGSTLRILVHTLVSIRSRSVQWVRPFYWPALRYIGCVLVEHSGAIRKQTLRHRNRQLSNAFCLITLICYQSYISHLHLIVLCRRETK